jgi:hypothetical protein
MMLGKGTAFSSAQILVRDNFKKDYCFFNDMKSVKISGWSGSEINISMSYNSRSP